MVGYGSSTDVGQLTRLLCQMTITKNPSSIVPITNKTLTTTHTSEVNTMQITSSKNTQQPRGKTYNNRKSKKDSTKKGGEQS